MTTLLDSTVLESAGSAPALTEDQARCIAVDAYIYLYPLVIMDITRKQFTNIEPGKEFGTGPMNMFVGVPAYPPADFKGVVRSNFDTLYSSAWLDLTKEPLVVSAPNTGGRYYMLPMLDMWTDVFASPGTRTTGNDAGNFLVTPPGWTGIAPNGFTRLAAPTPYVWIIGRTKTDGPADYEVVHKIQAGYKVTPLSEWGKAPGPAKVTVDPRVDMKTPPKTEADTMRRMKRILTDAAEVGDATARAISYRPRDDAFYFYPGQSSWFTPFVGGSYEFIQSNVRLLDARTCFFYMATGITPAMTVKMIGAGSQYAGATLDADRNYLDGSKNYRLHLPPNIPVKTFWSLIPYDTQTPSVLLRAQGAGGQGEQLDTDGARQGMVHHPSSLRRTRSMVRQDLAAGRDRIGEMKSGNLN
jgi:hypothetical protein